MIILIKYIFLPLLTLYFIFRIIQKYVSDRMTFVPRRIPMNGIDEMKYRYNGNFMLDYFYNEQGDKLWYALYNKNKKPSWDDIITFFCHGNSGNIVSSSDFEFTDKLAESTTVFIFDYRGYGLSEGSPTEKGVYSDTRSAWEFLLKNHPSVNTIIPIGHSLGASIVCHLLKDQLMDGNEIPQTLLLSAPFYDVKTVSSEIVPHFGFLNSNNFPTNEYLKTIHELSPQTNVFYLHSHEDNVIGPHHSKKLRDDVGEVLIMTHGSHNFPRLNDDIRFLFDEIVRGQKHK